MDQCTGHSIKIALVQQAGQAVRVGKFLQNVLAAHILRDHYDLGQTAILPADRHHRHHQKAFAVTGGIFELDAVLFLFELCTQVFRCKHLHELCVLAVGQDHILPGQPAEQIQIAALGRVQLLSPALVVFIAVIFQITHHKPVHDAGHPVEHLFRKFLAAL